MSGEEYDWLEAMYSVRLEPGDIAQFDQVISEARRAAAELLTHYLWFYVAVDQNHSYSALQSNLKFQAVVTSLTPEKAEYAFIFLCELLCQELVDRHGSISELLRAIPEGRLFARSDDPDNQFEVLKNLDPTLES